MLNLEDYGYGLSVLRTWLSRLRSATVYRYRAGFKSVVAESVLLRQQLLILNLGPNGCWCTRHSSPSRRNPSMPLPPTASDSSKIVEDASPITVLLNWKPR